jgi:hypothetical protein
MGGGKEIMMNNGLATADQLRDGEKRLKQKLLQIVIAMKKKTFNHTTSLNCVVPDIQIFRKLCLHTPYFT